MGNSKAKSLSTYSGQKTLTTEKGKIMTSIDGQINNSLDSLGNQINNFLDSLGNSADEIAQELSNRNIKGNRIKSGTCPLANVIKMQLDKPIEVSVSSVFWSYYDQEMGWVINSFSKPCTEFVLKFDYGDYPDLVEGR